MNNTRKQFQDIDEYIAEFTGDTRLRLEEIRKIIHKVTPESIEAISYQIPTFKLNAKNLIHFAGYKNHIGLYPFPSGIQEFKNETLAFKTSKGAIQLPNNEPLPKDLIIRIVKFRVRELSREKTTKFK